MENESKLTAANKALKEKEQKKYEADKLLFVATIYKTMLSDLGEKQAAEIGGAEVLVLIEKAKEATASELTWGGLQPNKTGLTQWMEIQQKAKNLRRDKLTLRGAAKKPTLKDIKEVTEEIVTECEKLNEHARKDISLLYNNLTTVIFPEAKDNK